MIYTKTTALLLTTALTALGTIALLRPAQAQTAQSVPTAAPAAARSNGGKLEEIVITAQKRRQDIQKIPAAVTVLTGRDMQKQNVVRLQDLQNVAPSLSVTEAGPIQNVNIRGVGIASGSPAVANGVATYVDGIFQPPGAGEFSYYDVGSIEVLRGPQGTFVGSNSTGGAIFINSNNPELGKFNGSIESYFGSYNARGVTAVINIPVTDDLSIRGALNYKSHDSYYTDIGPYHNQPGKLNEFDGRLGILYRPSDSFQALLKVEGDRVDFGGWAYHPIPGTAFAPFDTHAPFTVDYDDPTAYGQRNYQADLELRYTLDDGIVLRSVSGARGNPVTNNSDSTATAVPVPSATDLNADERIWSQEFNIISPAGGRFSWVGGVYFQHNRVDLDLYNLGPAPAFSPITNVYNPVEKTTTGIFGQVTYKLTPSLSLDVGARYSQYRTTQSGAVTVVPIHLAVADLGGAEKDGRPTGKVALNWQADKNNLVYAFVARGYKSGGVNSVTTNFGPETITDYEVGWKSTLLDDHVRTQIGGFYYDYSNFQFGSFSPTTAQTNTINLSSATIKGIEGQVQGRLDNFDFNSGFAFVESHLAKFQFVNEDAFQNAHPGATALPQCAAGQTANCDDYTPYFQDASGPNLYSPKWTFNAGVDYNLDLGSVSVTPRLNYSFVGSQWTYPGYVAAQNLLKAHSLLSALVTVTYSRYALEFYGTNLANARYIIGQTGNNEFYGAPLEVGLRGRVRF